MEFPVEENLKEEIKRDLKSTRRPYNRFVGYYMLEDIID